MSSLVQLWPEVEQSVQAVVHKKMSFFPNFEYLLEINCKEHRTQELEIFS
jgi:hypothetical protein